jgi:hypothetical protein
MISPTPGSSPSGMPAAGRCVILRGLPAVAEFAIQSTARAPKNIAIKAQE